jgi:hypothetical protein
MTRMMMVQGMMKKKMMIVFQMIKKIYPTKKTNTMTVKKLKMKTTHMQTVIQRRSPKFSRMADQLIALIAVQPKRQMVIPKLKSSLKKPSWQRSSKS